MATQKIAFNVALKKNQNRYNRAFGKYYPEAYMPEVLSLAGLIARCAFDQSIYSDDIIQNVIARLTKVMVEQLKAGQAVKWNGLGTFAPYVESNPGGVTEADMIAGKANPDRDIAGIHFRFIPENSKGEELTSRKFKDNVRLNLIGVVQVEKYETTTGKAKRTWMLQDMDSFRVALAKAEADSDPDTDDPDGGEG